MPKFKGALARHQVDKATLSVVQCQIVDRPDSLYDNIVASIYRAGRGVEHWRKPIKQIAEFCDAWVSHYICANKLNGFMQCGDNWGQTAPIAL
jgi:hypothetical protein